MADNPYAGYRQITEEEANRLAAGQSAQSTDQATSDLEPNMLTQSPHAYAALVASKSMQVAGGLRPVQEQIWKQYDDALDEANKYHQSIAEKQAEARIRIQERAAAITPGPDNTPSLAAGEELTRGRAQSEVKAEEAAPGGLLAQQKQRELEAEIAKQVEQLKPRPELTTVGGAEAPPGGWSLSQAQVLEQKQAEERAIQRPSDQDVDRVNGYVNGYQTAGNLQAYHAAWIGGTMKQASGWWAGMVDRNYKDYQAYLEGSITPLGRGVFGDSAQGATKDKIQENLRGMLINDSDDVNQAGDKTWMVKNRIIQQLQTDRATAIANHKDPSIWDSALGRVGADWNSNSTQQFHPYWYDANKNNPIVATGNTAQAKLVQDQLNATNQRNLPNQNFVTAPGQPGAPFPFVGGPPQMKPTPTPQATPNPQQVIVGQPGQNPNQWGQTF